MPKLRELKQLPPVSGPEVGKPPEEEWSRSQGMYFGIGSVVLLLSFAAIGVALYLLLTIDTAKPVIDDSAAHTGIGRLTPEDSRTVWKSYVKEGLRRPGKPDYLIARELQRNLLWGLGLCSAFAVLGGGLITYSVLAAKMQPRKPEKNAPVARR